MFDVSEPDETILESWKKEGGQRLVDWSKDLISRHNTCDDDTKARLSQFFSLALEFDDEKRTTDVDALLVLIDPAR
jgi:hypothetical protein